MIPLRNFSNFGPLPDSDDEQVAKSTPRFDPNTPDPEINPEEFKRMQNSIARFSQAMQLGKYALAQSILDDHKVDIAKYFPEEHPAHCSTINNQAMLYKINGRYSEAKEMFQQVFAAYVQIYGEHH
jgi:hypothetical protein